MSAASDRARDGWRRFAEQIDPSKMQGADGVIRDIATERELNDLAASLFANAGAQQFLDYLKSITVNAVAGPAISSDELRHLEGQRFIVALIERRVANGRERKPELPAERRSKRTAAGAA